MMARGILLGVAFATVATLGLQLALLLRQASFRTRPRRPEHDKQELEGSESVVDDFLEVKAAGCVIGTRVRTGTAVRKGVDVEGVMAIDNGALRIQPLLRAGWGRAGIAYGPWRRRNGLTFAVHVLNGHNTSQEEPLPDGFRGRLWRWVVGSGAEAPLRRMLNFSRSRQRKLLGRRLRQWFVHSPRFSRCARLDENFAVGWFATEAPKNPLEQGNALIMRALGPDNGKLLARVDSKCLRSVRGVQNVEMYYVVVLREQGAAYYAASIPNVPGFAAYPSLKLMAIDTSNTDNPVFAGIHQSVLGQIGFRVDSRIYGTQVLTLPGFSNWYGSAHAADSFTGEGLLGQSPAEVGGNWTVCEGSFVRTAEGLSPGETTCAAILQPTDRSGLLHVLIKTHERPPQSIGLIWRVKDAQNYWHFEACGTCCRLSIKENGEWFPMSTSNKHYLIPNAVNSMQVIDDGSSIRLALNGDMVYGAGFAELDSENAVGVGVRVAGGQVLLQSFEAHPREIRVPKGLDLGGPWTAQGNRVLVIDDFDGPSGELAGRTTTTGKRTWRKEIGTGLIQVTGNRAAKVLASATNPCPGRTAYTIEWHKPCFADLSVKVTLPGSRRGMNEKCRAGLILWQDSCNYIIVNLWTNDSYGMSISAFFQVDGFEELYDAVWSNIGHRIQWGEPYDFRLVCDGKRFRACVNAEPILYRALSDVYPDWNQLCINRVGIAVNWEWGNDTGSVFQDFVARDCA